MADPNALACLMLAVWPLVGYLLYVRLDPARALIWTLLAGYLLLPPIVAFNLPVVPDLDKYSIPLLAALAVVLFLRKDRMSILPDIWIGLAFLVTFVISPFATMLTNPEPVPIVAGDLPGLRMHDSLAAVTNPASALLPFFLARRYLATPEALRMTMLALIAAGLAYSVPMLVESRLSPQINVWVYGFFQHDFFQTIRFAGYRPVVFLPDGLWVAFFALMSLIAAVVILREGPACARPRQLIIALYLLAVLAICKSAGALVYGLALLPVLLLMGRRAQIWLAADLAVVVMVYPILRGAGVIPVDDLVAYAGSISPERAHSLQFRFANEDALLARAQERPWFGWGGYGRNLILDPVTGGPGTIANGVWFIALGVRGWLGYILQYGLLSLPLLLLAREVLVQRGAAVCAVVGGMALILAINMVDMLPNATLIPFTWLMAGALLGYAKALAHARRVARAAAWHDSLHGGRPSRTVV